jgi:hypothetical protein
VGKPTSPNAVYFIFLDGFDKSSLDDEAVHNFFWNNSTCTDLDFMAGLELGSVAPRLAVRCRVK